MFKNLYEKIQRCCGYVTVFEGDEVISEGTCFSFTDTGEVRGGSGNLNNTYK